MSNENQLFLLADHIKLSLLERKRAQSLNLPSDSQDGHISRSLDQFRDGLAQLSKERTRYEEAGDEENAGALAEAAAALAKQLDDLTAQFHGFASVDAAAALAKPNDPALAPDFASASTVPAAGAAAAATKKTLRHPPTSAAAKSVRFSDNPADTSSSTPSPPPILTPASTDNGAHPLFGARYRDDPSEDSAGYADEIAARDLTNTQIHAYHSQVMDEQDAQLDALGESVARQRELSLRMGDELDEHAAMLEDQERQVDRGQSRLDRARRQVGKITKAAGESKQMVIIAVLVVILVFLIIVLK